MRRHPRKGAGVPSASRPEVAGAALGRLSERLRELRRRDEEWGGDPAPEAVHQTRVAARRLRAGLDLFGRFLDLPESVRIQPLRRLERRLGALRDLDVLAEAVGRLPSGNPAVAAIAADLARERAGALTRAHRAHHRPAYRHLLEDLEGWLAAPRFLPSSNLSLDAVAPDLLLPALGTVLLNPAWTTTTFPDPIAPEARPLHRLRREVKRLRYQVECLAPWYGPGVTAWLDELHAIQDAIGAWHDAGMLFSRLDAQGGAGDLRAGVLASAMAALAPWPAWRERYLDRQTRSRLRALLLRPEPSAGAKGSAADAAGRGTV